MSCCGNKRAAYAQGQTAVSAKHGVNANPAGVGPSPISAASKMWADWHFINTAGPAVTYSGTVTGKLYRWTGKGITLAVDYRDVSGLQNLLKVLRRVK